MPFAPPETKAERRAAVFAAICAARVPGPAEPSGRVCGEGERDPFGRDRGLIAPTSALHTLVVVRDVGEASCAGLEPRVGGGRGGD